MKMILSIAFLQLLEKSGAYKCPENYLSLVHRQALIISVTAQVFFRLRESLRPCAMKAV